MLLITIRGNAAAPDGIVVEQIESIDDLIGASRIFAANEDAFRTRSVNKRRKRASTRVRMTNTNFGIQTGYNQCSRATINFGIQC